MSKLSHPVSSHSAWNLCRALLPLCALGVMTGCALAPAPVATTLPLMSGAVHGGQSPIQGSTVTLYTTSATAQGYGQAATVIGTAISDASGSFSIGSASGSSANPANCPAGQQAYLTAAGGYQSGNTATRNDSILLMAALGDCVNISASTFVMVNELTTVAAAYALSGFMTTSSNGSLYVANVSAPVANNSSSLSATPTAPAGLAHAFLNAAQLVSYAGGVANAQTSASSGGGRIVGIVPTAEINTLGNILSACVNSAGGSSACTSLFGFTPSIAQLTPANTLQALVNLARNPYPSPAAMNSSTGLLGLSPSAGAPFQPGLSGVPTDWSLAIVYNVANNGGISGTTNYGSVNSTYMLALDANDTVYAALAATSTQAEFFGLSPYGAQVPLFGPATSPASGNAFNVVYGIAPDALGNIWAATGQYQAFQYSAVTGALLSTYTSSSLNSSTGIAIDKANNVWIAHLLPSGNNIEELAYTPAVTGATPAPASWNLNYTVAAIAGMYDIAFDANQNLWLAPFSAPVSGGKATGNNHVVGLIANTGTAAAPAYAGTGATALPALTAAIPQSAPYGLAIDATGNAWFGIYGSKTLATGGINEVTANSTLNPTSITAGNFISGTTNSQVSNTGITLGTLYGQIPAIDGAGTMFVPDTSSTATGIHMYQTGTGQVLSPTAGIKGCYLAPTSATTRTTCGTGTGSAVYTAKQVSIDSTGSVWVPVGPASQVGGVTQIIGLAAPSYPLLSAGLPGLSPGLTTVNPLP